jgi:hypothetical protein
LRKSEPSDHCHDLGKGAYVASPVKLLLLGSRPSFKLLYLAFKASLQRDLHLLVALDILLEAQNITRSAERLYLSQSATSGILPRLSAFFEDDLLVQIGKKVQPTPFA